MELSSRTKSGTAYEDTANKFFENFAYIADACARKASGTIRTVLRRRDGLRRRAAASHSGVRSMVGILPLAATDTRRNRTLKRCRTSPAGPVVPHTKKRKQRWSAEKHVIDGAFFFFLFF